MPFSTTIDSLASDLQRTLAPLRRWRDSVSGELQRRGRSRAELLDGPTEDERERAAAITAPLLPTLYARPAAPLVQTGGRPRTRAA